MSQYLDSERRVYRSLVTGAAGSTCVTRIGIFFIVLKHKRSRLEIHCFTFSIGTNYDYRPDCIGIKGFKEYKIVNARFKHSQYHLSWYLDYIKFLNLGKSFTFSLRVPLQAPVGMSSSNCLSTSDCSLQAFPDTSKSWDLSRWHSTNHPFLQRRTFTTAFHSLSI